MRALHRDAETGKLPGAATARDAMQAHNSADWRRRGDEERLPLLHRGERVVKKLSKWQGIALKALYDLESLILLSTQPCFYSAKEVCNFIENDKQLTLKGTSRIDNALRTLQGRGLVDFELPLSQPPKYKINASGLWYVRANVHLLDDCHGAD